MAARETALSKSTVTSFIQHWQVAAGATPPMKTTDLLQDCTGCSVARLIAICGCGTRLGQLGMACSRDILILLPACAGPVLLME